VSTPGYLAATSGAAIMSRTDLEAWKFGGRDPSRMLAGVLTGRMPTPPQPAGEGIAYGEATRHCVLTPKGRMVADLWLAAETGLEDTPDWLWAIVPRAASEGLQAHLTRYLPPRFARLQVLEAFGVLGVMGPDADALVAEVVLDGRVSLDKLTATPAGGTVIAAGGGLRLLRHEELSTPGWYLLGEAPHLERLGSRLVETGAVPATAEDLRVARVEAGTPAYGADMDEETMPPEVGLEHVAIDHAKGCYTGQEVIVRIRDRGHVNRRLLRIPLGDVDPPASGTEVFIEGRDRAAAVVRSAVRSHRFGHTIALAYVRREVWTGEGDPPEFRLAD